MFHGDAGKLLSLATAHGRGDRRPSISSPRGHTLRGPAGCRHCRHITREPEPCTALGFKMSSHHSDIQKEDSPNKTTKSSRVPIVHLCAIFPMPLSITIRLFLSSSSTCAASRVSENLTTDSAFEQVLQARAFEYRPAKYS